MFSKRSKLLASLIAILIANATMLQADVVSVDCNETNIGPIGSTCYWEAIERNAKFAKTASVQCTSKSLATAKLFVDPNITNDIIRDQIGSSWTFVRHESAIISGKDYLKGHLISPRGGHQAALGYVRADEWKCSGDKTQPLAVSQESKCPDFVDNRDWNDPTTEQLSQCFGDQINDVWRGFDYPLVLAWDYYAKERVLLDLIDLGADPDLFPGGFGAMALSLQRYGGGETVNQIRQKLLQRKYPKINQPPSRDFSCEVLREDTSWSNYSWRQIKPCAKDIFYCGLEYANYDIGPNWCKKVSDDYDDPLSVAILRNAQDVVILGLVKAGAPYDWAKGSYTAQLPFSLLFSLGRAPLGEQISPPLKWNSTYVYRRMANSKVSKKQAEIFNSWGIKTYTDLESACLASERFFSSVCSPKDLEVFLYFAYTQYQQGYIVFADGKGKFDEIAKFRPKVDQVIYGRENVDPGLFHLGPVVNYLNLNDIAVKHKMTIEVLVEGLPKPIEDDDVNLIKNNIVKARQQGKTIAEFVAAEKQDLADNACSGLGGKYSRYRATADATWAHAKKQQ
ncbi:hypothetical protein N9581_01705, partial [Amylibacter sp.]|nr:hypothetical protein [Amylibacter sp.]